MRKPKPRKNRAYRRRGKRAWYAAMKATGEYLHRKMREPSITRSMFSITQVTEVEATR
jgi:hypothetical protein